MDEEALAEAKALLRIGHDAEDEVLAGLLQTAAGACEAFVGQVVIVRSIAQVVPAGGSWHRLASAPVRAVDEVMRVEPDGSTAPLDPADYAVDVDAAGEGWVKAAAGRPVKVFYSAGLAEDWAGLPDTLRQGMLRLAMHLYGEDGDGAPPASVAALWRPWRRVRL